MRILYLSPVGILGGAERCLLDMLTVVQQSDHRVRLHLIVMTEGPLAEMAREVNVQVTSLPMPRSLTELGDSPTNGRSGLRAKWSLARRCLVAGRPCGCYVDQLRQVIQRINPDLIHSNGIKSHLLTYLARPPNVSVVWHLHDFCGTRPLMSRGLRWAAGSIAGAIAVSNAVARDARSTLRCAATHTIYNTVNVDHFSPGPQMGNRLDDLAALRAAGDDTIRVGLVATFARWKGHDVFLHAAARLVAAKGAENLRFYIVGGPIYRTLGSQFTLQELRSLAARLGIADRVGFIEFQHDIAEVHRDLDVVVHASTQPEPFGLTIVEAMACGKPVIVSSAGGAVELFTDRHDAIGVPPSNPSALAAAIDLLVKQPELRRRLSQNARRTAVERFSRQRLGPQLWAVYEQATGRRCAKRRAPAA